jgi:hypothetical protein
MSQSEGTQENSGLAKAPVINMINNRDAENISWEIRDALPTPSTPEPVIEKDLPDQEENTEPDLEDNQSLDEKSENENEDTEEEKLKRRSLKVPRDKRISQLTRKNKQFEAVLADTLKKNQYLERQLALKEKEKFVSQKEKLIAEDKLLSAHIENIERAHATALEEGDYEKAAKATALSSQYFARKETLSHQKNQLDQYSTQPVYQAPQEEQYQDQPDHYSDLTTSEEFQNNGMEWKKKNSWADSSSRNFNPKLLQKAEESYEELVDFYTLEGRGEEIGSPEFFDEITQTVRESVKIPDRKNSDKLRMQSGSLPNATSVIRNGTPTNPSRNKNDIPLTAEEIKIAHSMSGIIRHNGQPVTDRATLEKIYKANKLQSQRG